MSRIEDAAGCEPQYEQQNQRPMKQWIGVQNSDGTLYHVAADNADAAYRAIGKVMGMTNTDDENFDAGNVDVNLYELTSLPPGTAKVLKMESAIGND